MDSSPSSDRVNNLTISWSEGIQILNDNPAVVQSAGGIVCRPGPGDLTEILLIHRPEYDDWTLPKGRLEAGETLEEGARREVEEETGLRCRLLRPAACTTYVDRKGREKVVWYWVMLPLEGTFTPNGEVDEVRWLTVDEALDLLSFERDRALVKSLEPLTD